MGRRRTRARTRLQLTSTSISLAAKGRAQPAWDRCRPRPTMRPRRRRRADRVMNRQTGTVHSSLGCIALNVPIPLPATMKGAYTEPRSETI